MVVGDSKGTTVECTLWGQTLETGRPARSGLHPSASLPAVLAEPRRSNCLGISTLPRGGGLMCQAVRTLFFFPVIFKK